MSWAGPGVYEDPSGNRIQALGAAVNGSTLRDSTILYWDGTWPPGATFWYVSLDEFRKGGYRIVRELRVDVTTVEETQPQGDAMAERYSTVLDISDVRAADYVPLVEKLEELASVEFLGTNEAAGTTVPLSLRVTYEVGPGGAAEDLWDLRSQIEMVEEEISDYTVHKLDKPTPVRGRDR